MVDSSVPPGVHGAHIAHSHACFRLYSHFAISWHRVDVGSRARSRFALLNFINIPHHKIRAFSRIEIGPSAHLVGVIASG